MTFLRTLLEDEPLKVLISCSETPERGFFQMFFCMSYASLSLSPSYRFHRHFSQQEHS